MTFITTLTKNGQMTLPKPVRDSLKAKPGMQLSIEIQGDRAVVSVQLIDERLRQIRKDSLVHLRQKGLDSLNDNELKKAVETEKTAYYAKKYQVS